MRCADGGISSLTSAPGLRCSVGETVAGGRVSGAINISLGERRWELEPADAFTFGRESSATACLDPADLGISRLAGSIEHDSGTWWLLNRSTTRSLQVVDERGYSHCAPSRAARRVDRVAHRYR